MPDTTLVKVSSKGLVTLPKKIRSQLGIQDGVDQRDNLNIAVAFESKSGAAFSKRYAAAVAGPPPTPARPRPAPARSASP